MNLETLQTNIKDNNVTTSFIIFVNNEGNTFLANQYVDAMSSVKELKITYIEDYTSLIPDKNDIFGCEVELDTKALYVYHCNEFDSNDEALKGITNLVVICNKVTNEELFKDFIIKMPKLLEWQIKDYAYSMAEGVKTKKLDWLIEMCHEDIYRIHNELSKLMLFNEHERDLIFDMLVEEHTFDDLSTYVIFDLTTALLKKDLKTVCSILEDAEHFDLEPLGLQVLLTNNIKNIISIQLDRTATAERLGMKPGQFYAISKSCGYYNKEQLLKIFDIVSSADYMMKNGDLSNDKLVEYMVLNMLAA